jgi:hypothetical protein
MDPQIIEKLYLVATDGSKAGKDSFMVFKILLESYNAPGIFIHIANFAKVTSIEFVLFKITKKQTVEIMGLNAHLYISHISDSSKTYLPHEFKPATIYQEYKSECLSRVIVIKVFFMPCFPLKYMGLLYKKEFF